MFTQCYTEGWPSDTFLNFLRKFIKPQAFIVNFLFFFNFDSRLKHLLLLNQFIVLWRVFIMVHDHLFVVKIVINFADHWLSYFYFFASFQDLSLNFINTVWNVLQSLVQREPVIEKSFTVQVFERPLRLMVVSLVLTILVLILFSRVLWNHTNLVNK